MEQFSKAHIKELRVLIRFVSIYCLARHEKGHRVKVHMKGIYGGELSLCGECAALVEHAVARRLKCPLNPKPSCKNCRIHCYGKEYRARIREVMAFSGRRMILRGRIDYLWHYLF
jgi:hypothetical protein